MSAALPPPEFSRTIDPRHLTEAPLQLVANEEERAALSRRFALVRISKLEASVLLTGDGDVIRASGTLVADIVQSCAISGDDLKVKVREKLAFAFVPESSVTLTEEEIELEANALDEIPYAASGPTAWIDVGEAVSESLALAIDPYATGPQADAVRQQHGLADEGRTGALAAGLAALLGKKD
ncbi:MAG: DUF177 domain-containing protein [Alteraurantiacibacter sp.]